jgi:hypothetical protein
MISVLRVCMYYYSIELASKQMAIISKRWLVDTQSKRNSGLEHCMAYPAVHMYSWQRRAYLRRNLTTY